METSTADPRWAAVVATRDRPTAAQRLLEDLLLLEQRPHCIVLVDQSARPETRRATARLQLLDQSVRYLHSKPGGASMARNLGIAALPEEIDWVWTPNDTSRMSSSHWVKTLGKLGGNVGAVVGSYEVAGVARRHFCSTEELTGWQLWRALEAATCWRVSAVNRVGRFDERLGTGNPSLAQSGEGTDLLARLAATGANVYSLPNFIVEGPQHHEPGIPGLAKSLYYSVGFGVVARRHFPARDYVPRLFTPLARAVLRKSGEGEVLSVGEAIALSAGRTAGVLLGNRATLINPRRDWSWLKRSASQGGGQR